MALISSTFVTMLPSSFIIAVGGFLLRGHNCFFSFQISDEILPPSAQSISSLATLILLKYSSASSSSMASFSFLLLLSSLFLGLFHLLYSSSFYSDTLFFFTLTFLKHLCNILFSFFMNLIVALSRSFSSNIFDRLLFFEVSFLKAF